jgi:hypothetical protein
MGSTFDVEGSNGKKYTLETGTNAWCRVETITGRRLADVLDELRGEYAPMSLLRQFMQGLIVEPNNPTLDDVGDIIDDMGGPGVVRLSMLARPTTTTIAPPAAAENVA